MTPDPDRKPGGGSGLNEDAQNLPFGELLDRDEVLLWQGRIGFLVFSSPVTTFALLLLASFAMWATWGSYSVHEFCASARAVSRCGTFYFVIPSGVLALAGLQSFDMLERRALTMDRAKGAVLLTDRRLIRVSDWPWRRVRTMDYCKATPHQGHGGVIRSGAGGSVILEPKDATLVLDLIRSRRGATP